MAFGFRTVNDDHIVQVDGEYPVMQIGGFGEAQAGVDHYFDKAITSSYQPLLFIRPRNGGFFMGLRFLGSPGSWTGFRFDACADQYHNHGLAGRNYGVWEYMIGEWAVRPSTDGYGLRVWDASGTLVYDAGVRHINLAYQFQTWQFIGGHRSDGWYYVMHHLDLPTASRIAPGAPGGNYLLINPFIAESSIAPGTHLQVQRKIGFTSTGLLSVRRNNYADAGSLIEPGIVGTPSP